MTKTKLLLDVMQVVVLFLSFELFYNDTHWKEAFKEFYKYNGKGECKLCFMTTLRKLFRETT